MASVSTLPLVSNTNVPATTGGGVTGAPAAGPTTPGFTTPQDNTSGLSSVGPQLQRNTQLASLWQSVSGNPSGSAGVGSDELVSNLNTTQLSNIYGGSADDVQSLGASQQSLTVGTAKNMAQSGTLTEVEPLLSERPDLQVSQVTTNNGAQLNQIMKDPNTTQALANRPDLEPQDLSNMMASFNNTFKSDPADAQEAYQMSLTTLGTCNNVKPSDMSGMLNSMMGAAGGPKTQGSGDAVMDMFQTAQGVLQSGRSPDDVNQLVQAAGTIGGSGGQGPTNPNSVADAFDQGAKTLQGQPAMQASQINDTAQSVANAFPGQDPTQRMEVFNTATQSMSQNAGMDAKGIDSMLSRGESQGLTQDKLQRSFDTQTDAVNSGAMSQAAAADPDNKDIKFNQYGNLKPGSSSALGTPQTQPKTQQSNAPGQANQNQKKQNQNGGTVAQGSDSGVPGVGGNNAGGGAAGAAAPASDTEYKATEEKT